MKPQTRGVFAQLALVIALVLAGAGALALLLAREFALQPATAQLMRSIDGFADAVEAIDREDGDVTRTLRVLRASGLEVRTAPPSDDDARFAPVLRQLLRRAARTLGGEREIVLGPGPRGGTLWLRLDTREPLWVAFAYQQARTPRTFSMLLLAGCVLLVWLAAAYFARRLAQPLRELAEVAPALVRGEDIALRTRGVPREVAELQTALGNASAGVRDAAAQRNLMLAGISHDLRTPLTRLQYALALLPDTDPSLREGMERDIDEIDKVLSQFIAYARDGRDEASEDVDLVAICRNALAAAGDAWEAVLPDRAILRGKPISLLRAVENLMGNAMRHGAAPFRLQLEREDDDWRIDIDDHGPGLPAGMATDALQPFVHGDGGGSGLGLAIVDRIARQHRGQLQLLPGVSSGTAPTGLRARLRLRGSAD
jgi:two-component system osmolarity sensor histidine kinase EnvZ